MVRVNRLGKRSSVRELGQESFDQDMQRVHQGHQGSSIHCANGCTRVTSVEELMTATEDKPEWLSLSNLSYPKVRKERKNKAGVDVFVLVYQ